jgi:hypothetical protein
MKKAAAGFRVHSGWAAVVAVAIEKDAPVVLVRERIHLVKNFTYESRQPYHTAAKLAPDEGRAFVEHIRKEARALALRAIRTLREKLGENGYTLDRSAIIMAAGRPLPALPKILAAHSLIHTADGELFREALIHASKRSALKIVTARERELADIASSALRKKATQLSRQVTELGRKLGPPWSQDEKLAALAAWYSLTAKSRAHA